MKTLTVEDRRWDLGMLAYMVFVVRNGVPGIPAKDRMRPKREGRPRLRAAIHCVRESRNALDAGDIERHLLLRERAMLHLTIATVEFYRPFAEQIRDRYAALAKVSGDGGAASKLDLPELERQIKACLKRGERTRLYVKAWADEHKVSIDTVYRRIEEAKRRPATD